MIIPPLITGGRAVFSLGDRIAGVCVLDDPFKPYICPLRTPDGHDTALAVPADHRHHKGLMYALKCHDVNFWEEHEPESGRQELLCARVEDGALVLDLLWRHLDGTRHTYREERRISCVHDSGRKAFVWTWKTRLESLRAHRLVQSPASMTMGDGRRINYHGLGVRLPWAWAFPAPSVSGIEMGGRSVTVEESCGTSGREITFRGKFDGAWPHPEGALTISQDMGYTWFVMRGPFAYLAVGPSNAREQDVPEGRIIMENYHITVEDRPPGKELV